MTRRTAPRTTRWTTAAVRRLAALAAVVVGLVAVPVAGAAAATPDPALGCGGRCILGGTSVRGPFAVTLRVRTGVPARLTVSVVEAAVGGVAPKILHRQHAVTPTFETRHSVSFNGLLAGTTYDVEVQATDREGRTDRRRGTVRTLRREVGLVIHRIDVDDDGDKHGPGEISFYPYVGADPMYLVDQVVPRHRVNSGDRVRVDFGLRWMHPDKPLLAFTVLGQDCDAFGWVCDESKADKADWATASRVIDLDHPGTRGTRTTPYPGIPAGHDGYVTFSTERGSYLRFTVFAYWDVKYEP